MSDTKYNGWTNYETWNVALWYDNDEGSYSHRCEMVREIANDVARDSADKEDAITKIAEWLESEIEEANPLASQASMFSDILGAALREVNYHEIAENWLDEVWDEITAEMAEMAAMSDE